MRICVAVGCYPLSTLLLSAIDLARLLSWPFSDADTSEDIYCPVVRLRVRACEKDHNHDQKCDSTSVVRAVLDSATGHSLITHRLIQRLGACKIAGQPQKIQGIYEELELNQVVKVLLEPLESNK